MHKTYTTQAIAEALNAKLSGDGGLIVTRLAHPADIQNESDLALATDPRLLPLLSGKKARAAIVSSEAQMEPGLVDACIVVDRPRFALAKLTNMFAEPVAISPGIHPSAVIEEGAQIGENVSIGAFAYVGADAVIGAHTVIHPQTYIGPKAHIGQHSLIHAGARIGAHVHIGQRAIIHFNASIGADGFSFVTPQLGSVEAAKASGGGTVSATNHELVRIASLGSVIIGDDVEIGASTSIDRGTIASTRIGNGTKIDNQVQVGHNVIIGDNCLICGRVGIAGSAVIGNRVVLGGAAGVADHVTVGDDAIAMAMSGIAGNIAPRSVVGGIPAVPRERMMENLFNLNRIKHFIKKVEALTERLNALEEKPENR
jgi:UDP-3-O-[3-hydroxymyristoyl] glucosamine N-acyltransferase